MYCHNQQETVRNPDGRYLELQFSTDKQLRKWKPQDNSTRVRCGQKLFVWGFLNGRKVFQMCFDFNGKTTWVDINEFPAISLSAAVEISRCADRLFAQGHCTIESLQFGLANSRNAEELEGHFSGIEIGLQKTRETATFDDIYRKWYHTQKNANRWPDPASARRPITLYEMHTEQHIGTLPVDKIRRTMIIKFMEPLFLKNRALADHLLDYISEVLEEAVDGKLIDINPCPSKPPEEVLRRKARHSTTLEYTQLPELMVWLEDAPFTKAVKLAMRVAVVTVHRTGVVANMRWEHFDRDSGVWALPERKTETELTDTMKSPRMYESKLPEQFCEALRLLYDQRKNETFVFSVDGHGPVSAEILRRNFLKFGGLTTQGFRNTFKTWCVHQSPPVDAYLVDRYVDHTLLGLGKNHWLDDMFEQRAQLAEKYCNFVMGSCG
jgi:integrase